MLLEQGALLQRHNLSSADFERSGWQWAELVAIHDAYSAARESLEPDGNCVAEKIRQLSQVHSVRMRTKDPDHLVAKLIRKRLERPGFLCNARDYADAVTDLIGVRALHLFKGDWLPIHQFITATWKLRQNPEANIREG